MDGNIPLILLSGVANNTTANVAANTTATPINYQLLAIIIAGAGFLVALFALAYNIGKELGELKETKAIVENRIEAFEQNYKLLEIIRETNGNLGSLEARINTEKATNKERIEKIESNIEISNKNIIDFATSSLEIGGSVSNFL